MSHNKNEIAYAIYRIQKLIRLQIQTLVKPFGLTSDQWIILSNIYNSDSLMTQSELAADCNKKGSAITRMLDIMEKSNLVRRLDSSTDRRAYLIALTPKGESLYKKSLDCIKAFEEHLLETFSENEFNEFANLLERYENSIISFK